MPIARRWHDVHSSARSVVPPAGRYLIVAPHPDDEVLTVGGLIAQLVLNGADVSVIGVTDGGSAYPEDVEHDDLARVRRREQTQAIERLGIPGDRLTSLGIRDGDVAESEDELGERLAALCTSSTTVVAPWIHDFHADHEAVGRAALRAAEASGSSVWFSLFWAWHHARPAAFDAVDLISIELDPVVRIAKAAALDCHASQLRPAEFDAMLSQATLEPARWPCEYFVLGGSAEPT